jgi:adenylate cyclase class 2
MGKHTEIELKARVHHNEDCRRRLTELAGGGVPFAKDDAYWFPSVRPPGASGLRVRREHTGEDGQRAEHTLVTYKIKERRNGLEINDEHEFEVSDGAVFEELLKKLGLEKRISKCKTGWAWQYDGVSAELVKVSGSATSGGVSFDGAASGAGSAGIPPLAGAERSPETPGPAGAAKDLGWFLELEILAGADYGGETIAAAGRRLLDLLARAGIGEAEIESRYYSDLLAGGVSRRDGVP